MFSVNIPVFNIEVNELVLQLAKQAGKLNADVEIRIYDDGSTDSVKNKNRELAKIPGVFYHEMERNFGRAAIRNKMGSDSEKRYLLFIDADSLPYSDNYLKNYLDVATPGCVICGGTTYDKKKPADQKKILRWVYGTSREAISAEERNRNKGFIITSNNFLIDRGIFEHVRFRENIGPYGHEDTLLGYDLFSAGIKVVHTNNPVKHTGLEDSGTFLDKTKKALENLLFISEKILGNAPDFNLQVRFLVKYNKITSIFPPVLLSWFFKIFSPLMEKNLKSKNPFLFCFDLYKLCYFSTLKKGSKRMFQK